MSSSILIYVISESKFRSIIQSRDTSYIGKIFSSQPKTIGAFHREFTFFEILGIVIGFGLPSLRALKKLILGKPGRSPSINHYLDSYEMLCRYCAYEYFEDWVQCPNSNAWINNITEIAQTSGLQLDLLNLVYRGALLKMPEINPACANFGYWKFEEIKSCLKSLQSYLESEKGVLEKPLWSKINSPLEDILKWLKCAHKYQDSLIVAFQY